MRSRLGVWSTRVGLAGFAVLLVAFALTAASTASGVHCPQCDRSHLTAPEFEFWQSYFLAKDGVYLLATLLLAAALPLATPRRWPFAFGFALALFAFGLTPM
jgi:hypothetical protein